MPSNSQKVLLAQEEGQRPAAAKPVKKAAAKK